MDALAKTLGVFALILILARLKVPLALAVLIGAACVGLLFRLPAGQVCLAAGRGAIEPGTVALAVITVCVLALSGTMQAAGLFERIVSLAGAFFRRPAVTVAALPALIGLLPMPGGALFSAPMVESAAGERGASSAKLSAVNYWFRHVWEYWWPLYPGVLAAMELTRSDFPRFAAFQIPLGVLMAAAGLLILRRMHPDFHARAPRPAKETKWGLLKAAAPILIIIVVAAPATPAIKYLPAGLADEGIRRAAVRYGPMVLGLLAALAWTTLVNRLRGAQLRKVWTSRRIFTTAALVVCVMIFRYVLDFVDAPDKIAAELKALHVPAVLVVTILPFVAGMVTGLAIGFVGTSFPIVLGLVAAMPGGAPMPAYVALAYAFGHMGQMLSPLHLCYVMSNEYFKASFHAVYWQILPSAVLTAALALGYFVLLRFLLA